MDREKRKELIRKFGPAHLNFYVHNACEQFIKPLVDKRNEVIDPKSRQAWKPSELIGRWSDIDRCDICGKLFVESDAGYVSISSMPQIELDLLLEIEQETGK